MFSIYICGGYNPVDEMKDCFKLDLAKPTEGWVKIAPMLKGRYNFALVSANGLIYAIGGENLISQNNDIEVNNSYVHLIIYKKISRFSTHFFYMQKRKKIQKNIII